MNDWPAPTGEPEFVAYTIEQLTTIVDSFALIFQGQTASILKIAEAIGALAKRVGDLETLAVSTLTNKATPKAELPEGHQGMYL